MMMMMMMMMHHDDDDDDDDDDAWWWWGINIISDYNPTPEIFQAKICKRDL